MLSHSSAYDNDYKTALAVDRSTNQLSPRLPRTLPQSTPIDTVFHSSSCQVLLPFRPKRSLGFDLCLCGRTAQQRMSVSMRADPHWITRCRRAAGSSPISLPRLSRTCTGCSTRTRTPCDPDASRFGRLRLPRSKQGAGKTGAHHGIVFRIVTAARGALFRNLHALESWVILNTVESDSEILRILIDQ